PSLNEKRHFDRSCSQRHREQRSAEICFSTAQVTTTSTTQEDARTSPRGPTKNKVRKRGKYSRPNQALLPTTNSPQIHHDLPRKTPRSVHPIPQNPLQKRTNRRSKKIKT